MLVNNPMGSRRRRRFYHRAGVVPIPGDLSKDDFTEPNLLNYEFEPFDYKEEEEFQPTSQFTQGGKRRVNFITVSSLHSRLMEIIDSMIALAEAEDREQAKKEGSDGDNGQGTDPNTDQVTGQNSDQGAVTNAVQPSKSKADKE